MSELIKKEKTFDLKISPLPFCKYHVDKKYPVKTNLKDILDEFDIPFYSDTHIFINQEKLDPSLFDSIRIDEPCEVIINALPKGGGKKNKLRTIAQIALMTVTPLGAGGKFLGLVGKTAKIVGSIVTYGLGNALINSVLPPQQERLPDSPSNTVDSPFQSITGIRNNLTPDGVIPVTFGEDLVYPVFGATPNTFVKDNKQFLRAIFVLGIEDFQGQISIRDMKIGSTPLANFSGVEVESDINYGRMTDGEKAKWFPNIATQDFNVLVKQVDPPTIRTTQAGITGLEVEITFPNGLVNYDSEGSRQQVTVSMLVEYRKVGDIPWIPVADTGFVFSTSAFPHNLTDSAVYDDIANTTLHAFGGALGAQWMTYNYSTGAFNITAVVGVDRDNMAISYDGTSFYLSGGTVAAVPQTTVTKVTAGVPVVLPSLNRARSLHSSDLLINEDGSTKRLVVVGGEAGAGAGTYEYLSVDTPVSWTLVDGTINYINDASTGTLVSIPNISGAHIDPFAGKDLTVPFYKNFMKLKGGNGAVKTVVFIYNGRNNFTPNGTSFNGTINSDSFDKSFSLVRASVMLTGSDTDYKLVGGTLDGEIYTISGEQISETLTTTFGSIYGGGYVYNGGEVELLSGYINGVTIGATKRSTSVESTVVVGNSTSTVIKTFRKTGLEVGQYEIRVQRISVDDSSPNIQSSFYLTAVRNFLPFDAIIGRRAKDIKTICLTIQGSEKLSGVVDTFNLIVSRQMPIPSALADGTFIYEESVNCASAALQVMIGSQAKRNLKNTQIDWQNMRDWYDFCDANNLTFRHTLSKPKKFSEILELIARAGWATQTELDGKRKFLFDEPQTTPTQIFSQRNTIKDSYEMQKRFIKVPDSIIVRFRDRSTPGWNLTNIEVFNDGFTESNAIEKESIDFAGATDSDYCYKTARRYLADLILRQELHTFSVSIDSLVSTRGDMIEVSHTNLLIGNGTGRIVTINDNGVDITSIEVDYSLSLTVALATIYEITIRTVDTLNNEIDILKVNAQLDGANDKKLNFELPLLPIGSFDNTDLVTIGENQQLIIKEVKNKKKQQADLICVPYADGVYTSDTGPIPPFTPVISLTPEILRGQPDDPVIDNIRTDETVMHRDSDGSLKATILVTLKSFSDNKIQPTGIQARYKRSDDETDAWIYAPAKNADTLQISLMEEVESSVFYDVYVRYTTNMASSEWVGQDDVEVFGNTLPPADVTGLSINTAGFNLELTWDVVADLDLEKYIVKVGGVSDDFDSATLVDELDDNRKVLTPTLVGDYQYFVKARDTAGNLSVNSAVVPLTVTAPKVPDEFTAVAIINQIQFGWTSAQTVWRIASYNLYKGEVFGTASLIKDNASALGYLHTEVVAGTFKYWIQSVDIAGNISIPVSIVVTVDAPTDFAFFGQLTGDFSQGEADLDTNIFYYTDADGNNFTIPCIDDTKTWTDHFVDEGFANMQDFINAGYIYYLEPVIHDVSGTVVNATYMKEFDIGSVIDASKIILSINRTVIDFDVATIRPTVRFKKLIGDPWTEVVGENIVFANNFQFVQIEYDFLADTGRQLIDLNGFTAELSIQRKYDTGKKDANMVSTITVTPATDGNSGIAFLDFQKVTTTQLFDSGYTTNPMILVPDIASEPTSFDVKVFNNDGTPNTTENVLVNWSVEGV